MAKLGLGVVFLICALLIGCAETSLPAASPPATSNPQSEHGGGDGGGGGGGM
jgi:hypothetical protein